MPHATQLPVRSNPPSAANTLARGLGLFSIALGTLEIVAPRPLARSLGMRGQEGLIFAYGVREIVKGAGILAARNPAPWVWGRVAGDALDLGTLAMALKGGNSHRRNIVLAAAAVAGVTALDAYCAARLDREKRLLLPPPRDYRDRRGMPQPPEMMRGAARHLATPRELRATGEPASVMRSG